MGASWHVWPDFFDPGPHKAEVSSSRPQERVYLLGDDWKFKVGGVLWTIFFRISSVTDPSAF